MVEEKDDLIKKMCPVFVVLFYPQLGNRGKQEEIALQSCERDKEIVFR